MSELLHPVAEILRRIRKVRGRLGADLEAIISPLALCLMFALAGCTAILDTSKSQCNVDQDCVDLFEANSTHICVQHVCERPFCQADGDCRSRGERFAKSVCSAEQHVCLPAECTASDECGQGRACDLSTNRCVQRQCSITQDCINVGTESPTMQCVAGFCVDESWGCIGQPDDRVVQPGEKGTLVFKILATGNNQPVPNAYWRIWVCGSPENDDPQLGCETNRVAHDTATYDPADGTVRITGLDPALPIRIWLDELNNRDGSGGAAWIPIEFISQKPAVGITSAPHVRAVAYAGLLALIESYKSSPGISLDASQIVRAGTASLLSVAFDCKDQAAAFVTPSFRHVDGPELKALGTDADPLLIFYFDERGLAYQSVATPDTRMPQLWTFPTGVFSSLNLPPGKNLAIKTSLVVDDRGPRMRTIRDDFATRLTAGRMTTVHFYPRNYAAPAAK